jgi:hypothetical protein
MVKSENKQQEQNQAEQNQAEQRQAVSIVLIETNGTIKTLKTKEISADTLYKKCGFRISDDFLCRHTWTVTLKDANDVHHISVWGKKNGKANFENKYDFPPPIDKELYFGTCAVVRTAAPASAAGSSAAGSSADALVFLDLTKETWLKIYEKLFGGFEDIGDEDEYSEDELENVDPALLTAHGYLKDDFVISDKDTLESGEVSAEEEAPVKKIKTTKKAAPKKGKAKKIVKEEEEEEELGTTSELEEDVYTFSDDD